MTDDHPVVPEITGRQDGTAEAVPAMDAVATLIHSFGSMIVGMETRLTSSQDKMEARLAEKIRDNANASKERWGKWEADFREYRETMDKRVGDVEAWQEEHLRKTQEWLQKQHDEELVAAARVEPVKHTVRYVATNWKTILLIVVSVLAVLGFAGDNLQHWLTMFGIR